MCTGPCPCEPTTTPKAPTNCTCPKSTGLVCGSDDVTYTGECQANCRYFVVFVKISFPFYLGKFILILTFCSV